MYHQTFCVSANVRAGLLFCDNWVSKKFNTSIVQETNRLKYIILLSFFTSINQLTVIDEYTRHKYMELAIVATVNWLIFTLKLLSAYSSVSLVTLLLKYIKSKQCSRMLLFNYLIAKY